MLRLKFVGRVAVTLTFVITALCFLRPPVRQCKQGVLKHFISQNKIHFNLEEAKKERNDYWILNNFLRSENSKKSTRTSSRKRTITLITQTTVNHLHALEKLSEFWSGPISISVLVYCGEVEKAIRSILHYYHKFPKLRANANLHLVIAKGNCRNYKNNKVVYKTNDLTDTRFLNGNMEDMPFPGNMLRNIALSNVAKGFVFLIDVDMVPSPQLAEKFLQYIRLRRDEDTFTSGYIVPAFEAENDSFIPRDKKQLLNFLEEGHIRTFSEGSCEQCQKNIKYSKWRESEPEHFMSYRLRPPFPRSFEPFYILRRDLYPEFDERFKGRHIDRMSQVQEVFMSGTSFYVLTECFLVHRGFRPKRMDYIPNNMLLYRKFREEIMQKYEGLDQDL